MSMKQRKLEDINEIILHCSANGPNSPIGAYEIRKYHMLPVAQGGRGWEDIGYHFVIKQDGTVEQGRKLEFQGAHCTGHNKLSIGVCLVGGVDVHGQPQDNFTFLQFEALAMMLRELRKRWPGAKISGHNEYANKACPVFDVPDFLKRYGIVKDPGKPAWDHKRWPHFKPEEFSTLWGDGDMPPAWERTLDALERLRAAFGKPLVLEATRWDGKDLNCNVVVKEKDQKRFVMFAKAAGFTGVLPLPRPAIVKVWGVAE